MTGQGKKRRAGPHRKPERGNPMTNGHGKSDRPIVPEKPANKANGAPLVAEQVEERGLAKGNPNQRNRGRTQCRKALQSKLERVRQAACREDEATGKTLDTQCARDASLSGTTFARLTRGRSPVR